MTNFERFATGDPGLALFRTTMQAGAPITFVPGGRYLDVGCCEADWLHRAHETWPDCDFVGVDWRAPNVIDGHGKVTRKQGNGLDPELFPPESCDGIVSLSAVEHFGLGHYNQDPLDADGDSKIVANCWRWLKPGGWFYFDVPYDPSGYRVQGTEYRIYDDVEIQARLRLVWADWDLGRLISCSKTEWIGYVRSGGHEGRLIERPTEQPTPGALCFYVAMCWIKA